MSVAVSVEQLLGGAVLEAQWAWLQNKDQPQKVLLPATGAGVTITDADTGDPVDVFADRTLTGAPLVQPLEVDEDGHVVGWVAQPQALNAAIAGGAVTPRTIPIGQARDPISITDVHVVGSDAEMLAIAGAHEGSVAVRTDLNDQAFMNNGGVTGTDADWTQIGFGDVLSVNGQHGVVVLAAADVGADPAGARNQAIALGLALGG